MLNLTLPGDLVARPEERLAIATDDDLDRSNTIVADSAIFDSVLHGSPGSTTLVAPFKLVVDDDPGTERYVKILAEGDRLITVIEFISPANKTGRGLVKYVRTRNELLRADVHVVEVDLVRRGNWQELLRPHTCPVEAMAEYRAVIRLRGRRTTAYVYPWPIRRAMESIPIPLRPSDPLIMLEVQQLLNGVYRGNRYSQSIDYSAPLRPPLEAETEKWANELLKTHDILRP